MNKPNFNARHDAKVADAATEDRANFCAAHGCPNRWETTWGGWHLCGPHSRAAPQLWPQITQEQCEALTQCAWRASHAPVRKPAEPMTRAQKLELLARLATMFRSTPQTIRDRAIAQAQELRERAAAGERLSLAQRDYVRAMLGADGS